MSNIAIFVFFATLVVLGCQIGFSYQQVTQELDVCGLKCFDLLKDNDDVANNAMFQACVKECEKTTV